ncbi:MAG TPA: hypothetical protein PLF12_05845 [Tenuifilum sp.]|uniref:hypothetical protein n=1 Tax=Tenuifilum sp. TaxID=2760880 RepID=UPI002C36B4CE|nr:hypothetical protein [Tenuifilum sp.]HON71214.1 hypothetical protein [Tenuifilum sp.]HQG72702.1 hypothetical protein [Tenuifilum sp.]HQI88490.1 hypothetical protein [Tenuifilum sp.]HRU86382.1 hypothetical protein [Tenuifilum sp.]
MKSIRFFPVVLLLLVANSVLAKVIPQTREYSKEFQVTDKSKLVVENRFGQVNIQNWDKSAISIYVQVKVDNSNATRAKALLDAIEVELSQEGDVVKAITSFNEEFIRSNRRMFEMSSDELSIDYTIKMPKNVDVQIENKFGDIYINELNSHLAVELKYGNIKIDRLTRGDSESLNTIDVSYGNASIVEANWIKTQLKYGKLEVQKLVAGVVLSRYSKISLSNVSSLVLDSKYDKYEIGQVNNLVGESGYTVFNIDVLNKKFNLNAKYGDVKIASVDANFENISFNAAYTGLKASIPSGTSYLLNANVSFGKVDIGNVPSKLNRIEGNTTVELSGVVGESANPKARVEINMKYGNATLY